MSYWEGLNRRKFPRMKYPCIVMIRLGQGTGDTILTHTENIGIGGICVITKQNIKLFTPVKIELDLLDLGEHMKCQGKVVWSIRRKEAVEKKKSFYDIGIEFMNLGEKETRRLEKIISCLVKKSKRK